MTRTLPSRWRVLAVVAVAAAFLAACGSSSSSTTTTAAGGGSGPTAIVFRPLDAGGPLTIAALDKGDIDIAALFSSQGVIAEKGWVVLEDDKGLQPVQNLVPVVRTAAATPAVTAALDKVSAALTTEELAAMNKRVDVDKEDPAAVAKAWAESKGLLTPGTSGAGTTIKVGSANFTEQEIVANLYADVLAANGFTVERLFGLGSREVVAPALEKGDIDVYPEYVGAYLAFLGGEPTSNLATSTRALTELAAAKGVTVLTPSPAEDKDALVVTKATADRLGLAKISDLTKVTEQLTMGGPPECPERPYCILGYERVYGLKFDV